MKQKWTKEPWHVQARNFISNENHTTICRLNDPVVMNGSIGKTEYAGPRVRDTILEANAQRIVDCVNALAGIEDPAGFMENVKGLVASAHINRMHNKPTLNDLKISQRLIALFPTPKTEEDEREES